MRPDGNAVRPQVLDGKDEPDRPPVLAGEPIPLQGEGSILALVVAQVPDDLAGNYFIGAPEHLVDGLTMIAGCDLETRAPGRMRALRQVLRDNQLTSVAQRLTLAWIPVDDHFQADGVGRGAQRRQRDAWISVFDPLPRRPGDTRAAGGSCHAQPRDAPSKRNFPGQRPGLVGCSMSPAAPSHRAIMARHGLPASYLPIIRAIRPACGRSGAGQTGISVPPAGDGVVPCATARNFGAGPGAPIPRGRIP